MKLYLLSLTTICFLSIPTGNMAIASAANISKQTQSISNPENLYQSGQNAFAEGNFAEAANQWQSAINIFRQQDDRLREAITLANLAMAYRELGQWQEATSAVTKSLELARSLQPVTNDVRRAIAQALDTQGSIAFNQGQNEAALQAWQSAQTLHQQDSPDRIRNAINQARAYQRLGLFLRTNQLLTLVSEGIGQQSDSFQKAELLHQIGNILLAIDDPAKADLYLQKSLKVVTTLSDRPAARTLKSRILLDLGHLSRIQKETQESPKALELYLDAVANAVYPLDRVNAQLSLVELFVSRKQTLELDRILAQMQPNIDLLPLSRNGIENRIRYAEILNKQQKRETAAVVLAKAIDQAKSLGDNRTYTYALGTLGHLYEQNQQYSEAINLTRQAIALAEANNADNLTYQWHWQLARLLKVTGESEAALVSYRQAVEVLKSIQGDLASAASNSQFSFQESIEPLYREYVSLLLETSGSKDSQNNQLKFKQAQSVIESLKVAELVNFFRSDCLKTQANDITQIDKTAAVIYIISLGDRLEVLLNLPNGNIKRYTKAIAASKIESTVADFRTNLLDASSQDYLEEAKTIYNWAIRPMEVDLTENKVQTLVIVSDQALRNIPFASLHDGNQFLIEKYSLAISPGLQLLDSKPIAKKQVTALLVGLTESRFAFSALPAVQQELESIQKRVGGNSSNLLLNETFTSQNLQSSIQSTPFPIVHIATHGQFSSKALETFIVAWDRKVNIEQLNGILQSRERSETEPLELLILSACQTASGDKRSALGLAGIAVRAGARSTIGSLWQISDDATAILMSALYNKLSDRNVTRAEGLRSAQIALLKDKKFNHPYYWSAFILLGNWQ